ncbi:hypothetical protein ACWGA9_28560 [Streptomyces sp. NPDC054950]
MVQHASGECELLMRDLGDGLLVVVTDFSQEPVVGKQVWFRVARSSGLLDPQSG